jgi:hypothetical protein
VDNFAFVQTGGWTRTIHHKGTATARRAHVWLDGGDTVSGVDMLARVPRAIGSLDLAPDGILGTSSSWVKPWKPNDVDDPEADVVFLDELVDVIRERFPRVERVFLAGYSGGGGMVQEYLRARELTHRYDGYGVAKRVLHNSMVRADGSAITPVAPFVLWYGAHDPHNATVDHIDWQATISAYELTYGVKLPLVGESSDVCGVELARLAAPPFVYFEDADAHEFYRCGSEGIAARFRQEWRALVP